ncbi:MAG: hypothetical protein J7M39_15690 [Anaerolineae bacterium]|nr:hypothetical protein [Anaerolineae bacterium]
MTRKTWSTVDVSSYLDGELTPEVQVAFETTVSQDPDLQHRVAEMRQVVALMRAVPPQEPPRNYLLTPAMVTEAESKPRAQRRRLPLLMMRIATSAAAAAFIVASGLTLMQRGGTPAMMTQSQGAPEAAIMPEKEAAWDEDEIEMLPAPVAKAVPVEGFAEAKKEAPAAPEVEKAVVRAVEVKEVEEEVVSEAPAEPVLGMQDAENIEEPGVGGGAETPAPEGDTDSAKVTTEISDTADSMAAGVSVGSGEPTPQKGNVPAEVEPAPTEAAASEAVAEKEEEIAAEAPGPPLGAAGEMVTSDDSETAIHAMSEDDQALATAGEAFEATEATPGSASTASAVWTPIGLGVVTAMLAGITYWLSRRQLD